MKRLYLDDLAVGQRFRSRSVELSEQDIIRFARENDPQFFHVDPQAAKASMFGGLVASGWQTAALAVKLLLESAEVPFADGIVGADATIAWRRPVRPGDALRIEAVVTDIRTSRSRPERGFVSWQIEMFNQNEAIVQTQTCTTVVRRDVSRG